MSSASETTNGLPARYEIRPLGPEHAEWAAAIVVHSNVFHSTVFAPVYPDNQAARFRQALQAAGYLVDHQVKSGLSFGVFDTEYPFKQPGSTAGVGGGTFYYEQLSAEGDDVRTGEDILAAMDFPLVSVALAYDGVDKLDFAQLQPLIASLPVFATVYHHLDELDPRDPGSWREPGARNRLLMRNATSTRREYEGRGLMAALARHLMAAAAARGFRMANIECLSDAVTHVWADPPAPFRGEVVAQFRSEDYRETDAATGRAVNPFAPSVQRVTRVCTTLGGGGGHR